MNVAICDDERYHRQRIETMIIEFGKQNNIKFSTAMFSEATSLLESDLSQVDIIFLDVTMPNMNGIKAAQAIREINTHCIIIFVTSFIEFAPSGYEVNAFRYILKEQLEQAFKTCMEDILRHFKALNKRFSAKFVEGEASILLDDLIFVESQKHKLLFKVESAVPRVFSLYSRLDEIETQINDKIFLRIHKSFLVNMDYIRVLSRYQVELYNKDILPITKSKYPDVAKKYILFRG